MLQRGRTGSYSGVMCRKILIFPTADICAGTICILFFSKSIDTLEKKQNVYCGKSESTDSSLLLKQKYDNTGCEICINES